MHSLSISRTFVILWLIDWKMNFNSNKGKQKLFSDEGLHSKPSARKPLLVSCQVTLIVQAVDNSNKFEIIEKRGTH